MKALFVAGITTCIYLHAPALAGAYLLYSFSVLYDNYKALQAKEALKAELAKLGYEESSEGVFKHAVEALNLDSDGSEGGNGGMTH